MGASSHVELLCAVCGEADQVDEIARYASFTQPHDSGIGDLVGARPTPDGDGFWGHTSGDVNWWYRLPQYVDPMRELQRMRLERDYFQRMADYYAGEYASAKGFLEREPMAALPWPSVERIAEYVAGDGCDALRLALADGIRGGSQ
jgi:hypothetical protein